MAYFNINEENLEKHSCSFCNKEKLCIYWFDYEDQTQYICVDCVNKMKEIFNTQQETHECMYIYKNNGFFCKICNKPAEANKDLEIMKELEKCQ